MVTTPAADEAPVGSIVRTIGTALFFLAALGFAAWLVVDRREEIVYSLERVSWWSVPMSALAALGGVLAIFRAWLVVVRDVGLDLRTKDALRVFGVGQVGKYLPGSVWSVIGPAQMVRDYGGSPIRIASATLVSLAVSVFVALTLGGLLLPFAGEVMTQLWFIAPLALVLGLLLVPSMLNRLIGLIARFIRRPLIDRPVSGRAILHAVGWASVANLAFGLHLMVLAQGPGAASLRAYLLCTSAYALAAAAGVLVFFAPAGAGAREGVMVLVLATLLTVGSSLLVALLSRVVMTAVEFLLALSLLRRPREPVS